MVNYQQGELFDLNLYTVKIPTAIKVATIKVKEKQTNNASQNFEWEQLELNLFLQPSNSTDADFLKLAA